MVTIIDLALPKNLFWTSFVLTLIQATCSFFFKTTVQLFHILCLVWFGLACLFGQSRFCWWLVSSWSQSNFPDSWGLGWTVRNSRESGSMEKRCEFKWLKFFREKDNTFRGIYSFPDSTAIFENFRSICQQQDARIRAATFSRRRISRNFDRIKWYGSLRSISCERNSAVSFLQNIPRENSIQMVSAPDDRKYEY